MARILIFQLDVLKCRKALQDALVQELSIENLPMPDVQARQAAERPDGVADVLVIYDGVFLHFFIIDGLQKTQRQRANYQQYCSAGTTQRCNYCQGGQMHWKRCAQNHRVSKLPLLLEFFLSY